MHPNPNALIGQRLAARIMPPDPVSVSQYLSENIILVDGPNAGELWSARNAPYLPEIGDCLSDDHPCRRVTVRKGQQTGISILALAWALFIADREPANTLYGVPGLDALRDINSQKLQPLIDAWERHTGRQIIVPQTSRSGTGSTTYEKKFSGGFLSLANANTVMDLSMKTVRKGVMDELSKWQDIPGYGDPETLFFGRFTAFRRLKNYKILALSTPEIDTGDVRGETPGHCRIDRLFKQSDQRFWNVTCPECQRLFVHSFERLKIDARHPHKTVYQCNHCTHDISESERVLAVRGGRWIPSRDEPDREPGFHIDAFISLMMSYEAIAEDWLNNSKTEKGRKDFSNLVLALPYKYRGDAPDHVKLMERRESGLQRGHVPPRGFLLVAAADVQMRGIWLEVLALAPNRESWVVDRHYLPGDTSNLNNEVWQQLRKETLEREFPDAFGRKRRLDAMGVDTGFNTHICYAWVRNNQRMHPDSGHDVVLAVKGMDGWGKPPIGTPTLQDIDLDGRKIKQGVRLWPIGTWGLKGEFYSNLHLLGIRSGQPVDPDGYCHFGDWLDEEYFKQVTAEHLADIIVRGQSTGRRWDKHYSENHLLDCRVYNLALAEYLGISIMTAEDWAIIARRHGMPEELTKTDLLTPPAPEPRPAPPEPESTATEPNDTAPASDQGSSWFGQRTRNWMSR